MKRIISILIVFEVLFTSFSGSALKGASVKLQSAILSSEQNNGSPRSTLDIYKENKDKKKYKSDELLIRLKDSADKDYLKSLEKQYGIKIKKELKNGISLIGFDSGKYTIDYLMDILNKDTNLQYAEPDYIMNISALPVYEPDYYREWGLKNNSCKGIDINAEPAWNVTTGSRSVVVGVIDTGIDYSHADLKDNIWVNTQEIPGNSIDDDGNGYVDDYQGWDFYNNDNNPYDDNNHGTHVSGIIAAESNSTGIAGVAPNVRLMALKTGNRNGYMYTSDVIEAINYGVSKGVKVFNCSFGSSANSSSEYTAMKNANALFICAAGNDGTNNDVTPNYPASLDLNNVISVASIDSSGSLSTFSNYGASSVDIAAPGSKIYSTLPGGIYGEMSGTSMATPFVTGTAAMALSAKTSSTPAELRNFILSSTHKLPQLNGRVNTGSLVDVMGTLVKENPSIAVNVNDFYLNSTSITLTAGQTQQLNYTLQPANATDQWVTWTSSNTSVAMVDITGKVTAVADGTAVIAASAADGAKNSTCTVKVGNSKVLTGISVSSLPSKIIYDVGESLDLTGIVVTGSYSDGTKASLPVSLEDTSGFDSSVPIAGQTVVVTIDGKAASFKVNIVSPSGLNVIAGADRYETAVQISMKSCSSADTVILATGTNFPDALVAGPLAIQENAPVLLTRYDSIPQSTLDEIARLNASKVIIMGSESAISPQVAETLSGSLGVSVERISGSSRFETAVETARRVRAKSGVTDKIVLATGWNFPDALSIGSWAAKSGIPVLLTGTDDLTDTTRNAIMDYGISEVVIAGGYPAISLNVENELKGMGITVTRISGSNRFATSVEIAKNFFADSSEAVIATGRNFPDALAAVPYAAKMNAPLMLVEQSSVPAEVSTYIPVSRITDITVVGGDPAVGQTVKDQLRVLEVH